MRQNKKKAFTLIELLVVISVLGVLALLAVPKLSAYSDKAKEAGISHDIKVVNLKLAEKEMTDSSLLKSFEKIKNSKISRSIEDGILYDINGKIAKIDNLSEKTYRELPKKTTKSDTGTKLKGSFYIDEKENVLYRDKEIIPGIKSITISPDSTWNINKVFDSVDTMNANTINIPIRVLVDNKNSNTMDLHQGDITHAKELIIRLREKDPDLKIVIEPFPWIGTGSVAETEWNPEDINMWFYNWFENVIKPLATTFNEETYQVEYLTVATNLDKIEYASGYWSNLFKNTKEIFDGKIIYRTNWWVTAEWAPETTEAYNKKINNLLFHDENLDYIGIASYFELSEKDDPSLEEIKNDLVSTSIYGRKQNVFNEIKFFSKYTNKKIIFGELGTPAINGFAKEPWNNYYGSIKKNDNAHYKYFKAYLDTFWKEDWFEGFSVFLVGDDNSLYTITDKKALKYIHDVK